MNELIVVTGSSLPPGPQTGTLKLYLAQLAEAGIESHVRMWDSPPPQAEGGAPGTLTFFIDELRAIVRDFSHYERIIATDGWDMLFFGTKEEVIPKVPVDRPLVGAALEYYPYQGRAAKVLGSARRKFSNGGMFAGTPESLSRLADAMAAHPEYRDRMENQGMLNIMLEEENPVFNIDSRTELFFTLYDGYPELDFVHGHPTNMEFATMPNFLHANGHWDTTLMWELHNRSLG